ncbi:MAG: helix-turn-helix domain-containing protein, partial [Bacteroidota bacterium]|nr:helix-turn-helix domain-containing protein [Bacteroidota bacterium]
LQIPMTEFLNKNIDAELILGREIATVNEQLANAKSYDKMLNIIEAFLWKKIQQIKDELHPVDKIGQLIFENPHHFSLNKFANKACLSASQMERRFVQQVGIPPKFFARICRFYQAFIMKERNPSLNWLNIAWETGYTDYQHLVKDFKEFSGSTPKFLFEEESNSPEQYLGLNPDFASH